MTTIATMYSGGELVGVGARDAGLVHLWGIEYIDEIAQVARINGFHTITADARAVNPSSLQCPDVLHASPPCPSFSNAKNGAEETTEDVELAQATVRFLEALKPRIFTLENVSMYRFSESWRSILDALNRLGYWTNIQNHLNCADYGVPQTRKRMIVRAILDGWLPPLPAPVPWAGWYAAIEDLLPGLPDSKFAPWQLERGVQDLLDQTCLLAQGSFDHTDDGNERDAQLIGKRVAGEPAYTVTSGSNMLGARAFLATGQYAQPNTVPNRLCQTVTDREPSPTVTASTKGDWRAFIADGANASADGRNITVRKAGKPMFTVSTQSLTKNPIRAAVPGRVVQIDKRCLARFQSIRDSYALPDNNTLAVRIIGNAVPPLLMQQLLEPFA